MLAKIRSLIGLRTPGETRRSAGATSLPEIAAVFCFLVFLWTVIALALRHELTLTEKNAAASTGNLAQAFEESMRRTVGSIDQLLMSARYAFATEGSKFDFNKWLQSQVLPDHITANIGITNRTGLVLADSLPIPKGVSIADRPHFKAQLDPNKDALYISQPVRGRVSAQETIQFTRKLLDAQGRFAGVIVYSLSCNQLSRFYDTVQVGNGFVALYRGNGDLLARGPAADANLGKPSATPAWAHAIVSRNDGFLRFTGVRSGKDMFASFRRLPSYNLIVAVGIDGGTVFRQYDALRMRMFVGGGAVSLLVLALGVFWVRQKRRSLTFQRGLKITLDTISQGILMVEGSGGVPVVNDRALKLLGYPAEQEEGAREVAAREAARLAKDEDGAGADSLAVQPDGGRTFDTRRSTGVILEVSHHELPDGGFIHTYSDVTVQRLAERRIRFLAHHDALTGLANRVQLYEKLGRLLEEGGRFTPPLAAILVDLDGFKNVNDTLGHAIGDKLLADVARRLERVVRPTDLLARLGGDEFIIVQQSGEQPLSAILTAQRILGAIGEPFLVTDNPIRIGASVGIAVTSPSCADAETLLKHTDIALYSAKRNGRGVFRVFETEMIDALSERTFLVDGLNRALHNDLLDVHLQPKFFAETLEISGFEALCRWKDPRRGFISPATFIPVAEETGLIHKLGLWVLERTCATARSWDQGHPVAVNVSAAQLSRPELPDDVAAILKRTGLRASRLEIEVTESVIVGENKAAIACLAALRQMGIRISLDDFGTGYSGLSYVRRFPFDKIKIDKSFVADQQSDRAPFAVLESIIALSHKLGIGTIAEGIETRQQLDLVRGLGCVELQGELLCAPLPAEQVPGFMRGWRPGASLPWKAEEAAGKDNDIGLVAS